MKDIETTNLQSYWKSINVDENRIFGSHLINTKTNFSDQRQLKKKLIQSANFSENYSQFFVKERNDLKQDELILKNNIGYVRNLVQVQNNFLKRSFQFKAGPSSNIHSESVESLHEDQKINTHLLVKYFQQKINIGKKFQARTPKRLPSDLKESSECTWKPETISTDTLQSYLQFGKFLKNFKEEAALELLHNFKGDTYKCMQEMIAHEQMQQQEEWKEEEIKLFLKEIKTIGKKFFLISKKIKTKSIKQCIDFYYKVKHLGLIC